MPPKKAPAKKRAPKKKAAPKKAPPAPPSFEDAVGRLVLKVDGKEWRVSFADDAIEAACRGLYEKHGDVLIALLKPLLGGAVSQAKLGEIKKTLGE